MDEGLQYTGTGPLLQSLFCLQAKAKVSTPVAEQLLYSYLWNTIYPYTGDGDHG